MHRLFVLLLLFLAVTHVVAGSALDAGTTLLASFEGTIQPDYCAGDWRAVVRGEAQFVPGRFGQAVALQPRQALTFSAEGKINPASGTVEFWVLWTEELAAAERATLFTFTTPKQGAYLHVNKIAPNRLGAPTRGGTQEDWTWVRVDVDPSGWKTGVWRHLAAVWEQGAVRFFVDGRLAGEKKGSPLPEAPERFSVGPGPLVIDELRISSSARTVDEIAAWASRRQSAQMTYASRCSPVGGIAPGVGFDAVIGPDGRRLPLALHHRAYARGLALPPSSRVAVRVPGAKQVLTAMCGASAYDGQQAAARVRVLDDNKQVWVSPVLTSSGKPTPMRIPVSGQTVRFECTGVPDRAPATIVLGDAAFLSAGASAPPSFSRVMSDDETSIQRMRLQAARFRFKLPPAPKGYVIYAGHPVDEVNPDREPMAERFPSSLTLTAAPGEYEAAQFILCAARDLQSVQITVDGLRGERGAISTDNVRVSLVRRTLMRKGYWMPRAANNYEVVSRFLFPNHPFDLPQSDFKEVHVLVHVPSSAAAGEYVSTVRVSSANAPATEMKLRLTVLPITLVQPKQKRYGMYYRLASVADRPEVMDAEFADLAAHGCTMIKGHAAIVFTKDDEGVIHWNFDLIRTMLEVGRKHGFFGETTIYDNLPQLAALMGYKGLDPKGEGDPVSGHQDLIQVARKCFADLRKLNQEYPETEFLLTHMDEVFGRGRLARYIDYAKVIRQASDFRIYITMHTTPGRWEQFMEQSDPYIDVRCHNGHALENWLRAGHTWDEAAKMWKQAGDDGWMYHNMRGSFFRAEWNRFINGLFMWVSPLEVHVPWMYYSYGGDPFDDTDSDRYDFGYAFPSPDDPTQMISTLHWEAFREGYDDMRYLVTLEQTIQQARAKGADVSRAVSWLAKIETMLPQLPGDIADIDLESPYTVAATRKFTGADYDAIRRQTADHIIALQTALKAAGEAEAP